MAQYWWQLPSLANYLIQLPKIKWSNVYFQFPKKEKCKFSYQKWQNFEDDECCRNSDVSVESDGANDGQEDEEDAAEAEAQLALDEEPLPA